MSNKDKKEQRVLYISHKGEILFWLIILLFITIFGLMFYYTKLKHTANEYRIYMPDVDGLIVGSPVRMMGIEVGHVTKIKPIKDEVYVRFVLHDKSIKIPQGTEATVEFSGMAGSKSLEVYLPEKDKYIDEKQTPIIQVNSPKRLHDAAGLLYEMFKELDSIIKTSAHFGQELDKIEIPKAKQKNGNFKDFLEYSDGVVDESQRRMEAFGRKINNGRK